MKELFIVAGIIVGIGILREALRAYAFYVIRRKAKNGEDIDKGASKGIGNKYISVHEAQEAEWKAKQRKAK